MITAAKDILAGIITAHTSIPAKRVARSAAAERDLHHERAYPFVALITADGSFENTAGTVRYEDTTAGSIVERLVRGTRTVPMEIRLWAEDETDGDRLAHAVIRHLPTRWEYDGFAGAIDIADEAHTDNAANITDEYVISILARFSIPVAPDAKPIDTVPGVSPRFDDPGFREAGSWRE